VLGIASDVANSSHLVHVEEEHLAFLLRFLLGNEFAASAIRRTRSCASVACLLLRVEELSSTELKTTLSSSFVLSVAR